MKRVVVILIALLLTPIAKADKFSTGIYLGSSNGEFKNNTQSSSAEHYGFLAFLVPSRGTRWGASIERVGNNAFQPKANGVGLSAQRTLFSGSYERRLVLSEYIKPFLGAGLVYSQNEFTNRFSVDDEGFFEETLADESSSDFSLQLLASQELTVWENISFGFRGKYELSSDTFAGLSLSLSALYQF